MSQTLQLPTSDLSQKKSLTEAEIKDLQTNPALASGTNYADSLNINNDAWGPQRGK